MKGMAALALLAGFSSCVKDVDGSSSGINEEQKAKENAELQLGFMIPDGQTWDMASQVEANVTVNGDYDANYTVTLYENNPFASQAAVVLGKAEVKSGSTANINFTCPNSVMGVFAAIKDKKGYSYVKPVAIVDGKIETTFGGEAAAGARTMRAARTSAADDFVVNVRTMPDLSTYIDDAKAITPENNKWAGAEHYLIPEGTEWNDNIPYIQAASGISVYVQGTLNINSEQKVNGGCVFIVGPKGTVNIAKGTQLVTNANNNAGTVGSFYVYPGGKVQGEGTLQFANGTGSYNYNGGTIDVGTINNNGGTLYNAGVLEADVMEGGAGLSIYENAGKVHIGKCVKGSSTANTRIHNNCWWECDGDIYCRNIQQGPGAYIKGANLGMSGSEDGTGDAAYIWAKGNSLIDIPGYVAFNNIDIVGPTDDSYAYLQFGEVTGSNRSDLGAAYHDKLGISTNYSAVNNDTNNGPMATAISNNIRLSLDTYDLNWNIYQPSPCGYVLDMLNGTRAYTAAKNQYVSKWAQVGNGNAVLVAKGQVDEVKTESKCSPGIDIVPPTPIYEEMKIFTYAFEDQTLNTDYDLNDVVLKVNYHVTETNEKTGEVVYDKTQLDVQLVAAGATYDIKAKIGDNYLFDGKEIHQAMKQNKGMMINTGGTGGNSVSGVAPAEWTVAVPTGWNGKFEELPVSIEVSTTKKTYAFPNDDIYPHVVMIPVDWAWPIERVNIKDAYPGTADAKTIKNTYKATYTNKETNELVEGEFTMEFKENSFAAWATSAVADRVGDRNGWYKYPSSKTMTNSTSSAQ